MCSFKVSFGRDLNIQERLRALVLADRQRGPNVVILCCSTSSVEVEASTIVGIYNLPECASLSVASEL